MATKIHQADSGLLDDLKAIGQDVSLASTVLLNTKDDAELVAAYTRFAKLDRSGDLPLGNTRAAAVLRILARQRAEQAGRMDTEAEKDADAFVRSMDRAIKGRGREVPENELDSDFAPFAALSLDERELTHRRAPKRKDDLDESQPSEAAEREGDRLAAEFLRGHLPKPVKDDPLLAGFFNRSRRAKSLGDVEAERLVDAFFGRVREQNTEGGNRASGTSSKSPGKRIPTYLESPWAPKK